MVVIADASALRYLAVIGHPELSGHDLRRGLGTRAVLHELLAAATPDTVRTLIQSRPRWLRTQEPSEYVLRTWNPDLDRGERAAIALAIEVKADLILIDDSAGRGEAVARGMRITGTVGVLRLAAERGLIDVRASVDALQRSGFYIRESVIRAAFGPWLAS